MPGRGSGPGSMQRASYDAAIDPEGGDEGTTSVRRWGRPTPLQRILGGAVGAVLGAIVTVGLLLAGLGHWTVGLPIPLGAGIGAVFGDRGLRSIIRAMDAAPFP